MRNGDDDDNENLATSTKLTDNSKPRCKRFTAARSISAACSDCRFIGTKECCFQPI